MADYSNWKLEKDSENIIWLGIDRPDAVINSINESVLDELNSIVKDISQDDTIVGLVIYSAKEKGFIAGADVHVFSKFTSHEAIIDFLRKGQAVFAQLESLKIPTVAMIDGFCMGGGLELALACRYRIARDDNDTKLGLPEILLGFNPGWGGTVRLPRLIGGLDALSKVILTGAPMNASKAKRLGIVDDAVPLRQLKRAAVYYIKKKPPKHQPSFWQSLTNYSWMRKLLAAMMARQVARKVSKNHYPAPFAVIDLWEKEGGFGDRAYLKEVDSVDKLISNGETAKNLIRLFLLQERLKGFAKASDFKAKHVHVIGAGVMGGGIAAWCALKGITVTLQDKSYEQIAPAMNRAFDLYKKKCKKPRAIQEAMDRLMPDPEGHGIAKADVIIEAAFENLDVKKEIMRLVESNANKDAIIATNTSSIPLDEINVSMENPKRLVGIHFFNPVSQMQLIEVVSSKVTETKVSQDACAFVTQIGKLPLPVTSSPGFLVNRVLMPYLLECVHMLEEGIPGETIDKAATDFGMMMGPVELADTVGMDVCLAVAENLTAHYGGTVPKKLRTMVESGKLGRKTGEGFYQYKNGKPVKKPVEVQPNADIANRLITRIINESASCLREGVVKDSDLLDAGMVFATGFAPFTGGPMNYAKHLGETNLNNLFTQLESTYGERFKMDNFLDSCLSIEVEKC